MKKATKNKISNTPLVVLDEHPDWLNPLYEEFTRQGIEYKKINISEAAYNPQTEEVLPFYVNRLSPSAAKRGHQSAFQYTLNYLQFLEFFGARIVNGSHTVLLETSKAYQAALMHKLNIPQPKTLVFNSTNQILDAIDDFEYPLLIKPNCGGSGMGITKFLSKKELINAIETNQIVFPQEQLLLVQEFIQPKDGHIVRVETINKKFAYAMKVYTSGTFNLCPSDGCDIDRGPATESTDNIGYCVADTKSDVRFELYEDIPAEIVTAVETLVTEANLETAGIEYVVDSKGQWYIYDINALSILRSSFKEEYGIDAWKLLADYFIAEYRKAL